MDTLSLTLPEDIRARLEAMAERNGQSLQDCAVQALAEWLDEWEDYQRTLDTLQEGEEDRARLSVVNE